MKISYKIIKRLAALTNREMDLFLCLARYQKEDGRVENIYYRTILNMTGMCKQTFYTAMRSLEAKGVIVVLGKIKNDFVVKILDNDFSNHDFSDGYINLNREIFHKRAFKSLKANEKWLVLEMMKNTYVTGRSHQIYRNAFYEKYKKLLGVTTRMLREYLLAIKIFFSIGRKKGKYFITAKKILQGNHTASPFKQHAEFYIKAQCRQNKIEAANKEVEDTIEYCFIKRYKRLKEAGLDIYRVFTQTLLKSVKNKAERVLNPKYINKLITEAVTNA